MTATPENRKVLGPASPATMLATIDQAKLQSDMAYRREIGWNLAASVLTMVPAQNIAALPNYDPDELKTIPRWLTWYDAKEFTELFDTLYGSTTYGADLGLTPNEARQRGVPFSEQAIKEVFELHSKKAVLGWTEARLSEELGKIKALKDLQGLVKGIDNLPSGIGHGITAFSPELMAHVLRSFAAADDCGPKLEGLEFKSPPQSKDNFTICLKSEFPGFFPENQAQEVAIAIKATWQKVKDTTGLMQRLPVYRHDALSLVNALKAGNWDATTQQVTPDLGKIFSVQVNNGMTYMLTGMHIMSKQARHWLWASLWWASDPDQDFGADRPQVMKNLGRGLDNYKMCIATDFDEGDPEPWKAFDAPLPLAELSGEENSQRALRLKSLAGSLKAVHQWSASTVTSGRPPTWCSNPFIEIGQGNNRTNCIGCHQHAGSDVQGMEPITDEARFPASGRTLLRSNFPTDYLWSFTNPPEDFVGKIDGVRSKDKYNNDESR